MAIISELHGGGLMDPKAAFNNFKDYLGDSWDEISEEDKDTIKEVFTDYVNLWVQEMAGVDTSSEKPHIDSQLASITSFGAQTISDAITASLKKYAIKALSVAVAAAL